MLIHTHIKQLHRDIEPNLAFSGTADSPTRPLKPTFGL
jgi:hypothetical protein